MLLTGNIVQRNQAGYGKLSIQNGIIERIELTGQCQDDANWILPGFIDVHLHGIYNGDATPEKVHLMAQAAPQSGLTTFCPSMASDAPERMLEFVKRIRELMNNPLPGATRIAGSHLEGPYMEYVHKGGMNENFIRMPDMQEVEKLLEAADGTLKIMTISPELPNALEVTRRLTEAGVRVSGGHTGMSIDQLDKFIQAGGQAICHLFNTFDGRNAEYGVSMPALADAVLVDDRLFIELITDGVHVKEILLKLAIRAAGVDRIIGITDSMFGTGLPDGIYPMPDAGRTYTLKAGDVGRLTDNPDLIVGSCLTQNWAFYNLTRRFGFPVTAASRILSGNPARYLNMDKFTGELRTGLAADIAVLAPDYRTVKQTFIDGQEVFNAD